MKKNLIATTLFFICDCIRYTPQSILKAKRANEQN